MGFGTPGARGPRGVTGATGAIGDNTGATIGGTAFVNDVVASATGSFSVGATLSAFKDIYVSGTIHFVDDSGTVLGSITSGSA